MARFKVNIEFIQICNTGDFKYPATCCIEDALSKEIRSGLLDEHFRYAEEQGSLNINVKFIDYKHDND